MDDERLLAEALRAQAAGGVSTPAVPPLPEPADDGVTHPETDGRARIPGRFRPLGLGRRVAPAPVAATVGRPAPGPYPGPIGPPRGPMPTGAFPGPAPEVARAPQPGGWTGARVAWWSAVAVLGGGVLGGVLAVISLAAPG